MALGGLERGARAGAISQSDQSANAQLYAMVSDNPETFAGLVAGKILRNQNLALLFFVWLVRGSDICRKPKETGSERFA
jgi:hypothetical protein